MYNCMCFEPKWDLVEERELIVKLRINANGRAAYI